MKSLLPVYIRPWSTERPIPWARSLLRYGATPLIERALREAGSLVGARARGVTIKGGHEGLLWPLFLVSEPDPSIQYEIDTCATALGFAVALGLEPPLRGLTPDFVSHSLTTLIALRRPDGSWPSIQVAPGAGRPAAMEGVVNDTIFALNALIDSGFLDGPQSHRQPSLPSHLGHLQDIEARLDWLSSTVGWIANNRVGDGWFYTSTEYMASKDQFRDAVGPTAGVTVVLSRLLEVIPTNVEWQDREQVRVLREKAAECLCEIQHASGGFGQDARDRPRIAHTALALLALTSVQLDARITSVLLRAIDWILDKATPRGVKREKDTECFDEYQQAIISVGQTYSKRMIAHENPVEPLVLLSLCATIAVGDRIPLGSRRKRRVSSRLVAVLSLLFGRQVLHGPLRGAFVSRRHLESERYPIYWVYHSVRALQRAGELFKERAVSLRRVMLGTVVVRFGLPVIACALYWRFVSRNWLQVVAIVLVAVAANGFWDLLRRGQD